MTYLSDKKKQQSRWIRYSALVIFLLVISIFWKQVRSVAYPVVIPVAQGVSNVLSGIFSMPSFFSTYLTSHKTSTEKIELLEKNIELLENRVASQDAELEHYIAKDELQSKGHLATLEVNMIAQDLYFLYSTMLISKGFTDGVEEGMIVYTRGYEPVGTVTEVYGDTALVSLLSSTGNKVNGFTGQNKITLPLVGDGGGNFISQIQKDIEVKIGDDIFLSQNPVMKVGNIVDIQGSAQDFFRTVYIRGAYNPAKQNNYFIDK